MYLVSSYNTTNGTSNMLRLQRIRKTGILVSKGGRCVSLDTHGLSALPLFAGIREEDIPAMLLCLGSFQKRYKKDETILLESNEVRNVGVILSGSVHMIKEDADGYQTLLVNMKEGELFGESFSCGSFLDARVSFFAATPCSVLFLPFYKVIHTCKLTCTFHHRLIENMVRLIGDKNVQLMQKIEVISKRTLREKIMAYLRNQSLEQNSRHFSIPLGRLELAEYLCADRSALTRELSSMQKDGLIWYEKNIFEIL